MNDDDRSDAAKHVAAAGRSALHVELSFVVGADAQRLQKLRVLARKLEIGRRLATGQRGLFLRLSLIEADGRLQHQKHVVTAGLNA